MVEAAARQDLISAPPIFYGFQIWVQMGFSKEAGGDEYFGDLLYCVRCTTILYSTPEHVTTVIVNYRILLENKLAC